MSIRYLYIYNVLDEGGSNIEARTDSYNVGDIEHHGYVTQNAILCTRGFDGRPTYTAVFA